MSIDPVEPTPERRSRRPLLLAVAVILAVWLVGAGVMLWQGAGHVVDGRDALDSFTAEHGGRVTDIDGLLGADSDIGGLQNAAESFRSARKSFDSVIVAPLKVVPVLGRQIRSVAALSNAAEVTTSSVSQAVAATNKVVTANDEADVDRVGSAAKIEVILTKLQEELAGIDLGPDEGLVGQLASARNEFADKYRKSMSSLNNAVAGVRGTRSFLAGPDRYLVLAGNNAEMRAGSGMFLQIGTMNVDKGMFDLGDFEASGSMYLPESGSELDPTLQELWGPLEPTREFRNVNLTPRFDESARMATEMWASSGRDEVQGALALDVIGLKRLLALVGSVQVPDSDGALIEINADNVEAKLLLEQYLGLDSAEQVERKARLGEVAGAIFESLNTDTVSLVDLIDALRDIGAGRHLMMWSSDATQQKAWKALGVSGELKQNDLLVALINRGGNKLDPFITTAAELSATTAGTNRRLSVAVTMSNTTPVGLPLYVQGPYPGTDLAAGDYAGLLAVTVPGGAGNPSVERAELVGAAVDGPTKVIVAKVLIHRNQTLNVTISFDLPTTWSAVDILPAARTPPMEWKAGARTWVGNRNRTVALASLGR